MIILLNEFLKEYLSINLTEFKHKHQRHFQLVVIVRKSELVLDRRIGAVAIKSVGSK